MRHDHPLAAQDLDLDTFCQARHLLVSFSGRPFGFVDEALASLGRERHVVLTVNQFFTAGQVVAHSNLLTVLPQHFLSVTGVFDQLIIKPLPFQVPTVHVDMVWRKRLRQPNAHQWLRQAVTRASLQTLARIKA
jgi:DNA-binding transcriptional LysR family regulator